MHSRTGRQRANADDMGIVRVEILDHRSEPARLAVRGPGPGLEREADELGRQRFRGEALHLIPTVAGAQELRVELEERAERQRVVHLERCRAHRTVQVRDHLRTVRVELDREEPGATPTHLIPMLEPDRTVSERERPMRVLPRPDVLSIRARQQEPKIRALVRVFRQEHAPRVMQIGQPQPRRIAMRHDTAVVLTARQLRPPLVSRHRHSVGATCSVCKSMRTR